MIIRDCDRAVVKWAVDQGYPYAYVREHGLPDPSLRIHLGLSTAYFEGGRLVHWRAESPGRHMDQLMFELTSLFGCCASANAYPEQEVWLSPAEQSALRPPYSKAS